jgi:hypothetical protein
MEQGTEPREEPAVCRMCEGFSLEDALALDAAHIAEYGFRVVSVGTREDDEPRAPWAYTVGLLDAADHPELIIAGASLHLASAFLSGLARMVLDDGDRFEVGDEIDIERGILRFGAVNEIQYVLNTFNWWHNLAEYGAVRTYALEALQVVLPPDCFCEEHGFAQALLANPAARVGGKEPFLNRAARRSRGRRPPRARGRAWPPNGRAGR